MEIYAETIAEAWEKSIIALVKLNSVFLPTEKGIRAKEISNMIIHIENPEKEPRISQKYCFPKVFTKQYINDYFSEYSKMETPYSRISKVGKGEINQIDSVISKLKTQWYTRRAIISIWVPQEDLDSNYPPCICMFQFMIRDKKLVMTAILRSNDAWLSALPDMIMISNIQRKIALELNLDCGEYVHHAISYHIYDHDYSMVVDGFR